MSLRRGDTGPAVVAWQRILAEDYPEVLADGVFGKMTEKRTIQWQLARGLSGDGVVGNETMAHVGRPRTALRVAIQGEPGAERWPFLQAATWRWVDRKSIRLIPLHVMQAPEKPDTAEAVAAWFAGRRGPPPLASAHFCADQNSAVRCVLARHQAAAAPGANADGYHVEMAGYAEQSAADWNDTSSMSMIEIVAEQCARVTLVYDIPVRRLSVAEVAGKLEKGFCDHYDVTRAFKKSTHVDVGNHFPWDHFLRRVEAWQGQLR